MNDVVGTQTKTGVALEAAFTGTPPMPIPARAQGLLDFTSNSIQGSAARIDSGALRPGRYRRKGVAGAHEVTGSVAFEVTPDVCSKMLYAALGTLVTTGATAPYTHTMTARAASTLPSLTISRSVGPIIVYHAGAMVNTLTLRTQMDQVLTAEAEMVAIREVIDTNTAARDTAIFGTAGYSVLDAFVFNQALVRTGNDLGSLVDNMTVRGFDITIGNNLLDKRVIRRARTPLKYTPQRVDISGSMDMFFESEFALRKAFGNSGAAYPFEAGSSLGTGSVTLEFISGANILLFEFGYVEFEAQVPTVDDEGYVMQPVTLNARENINSATAPFRTVLTNSEALIIPATPVAIT